MWRWVICRAVDACVKEILKAIAPKRIDVLVNNAGIVSGRSLSELSPAQIRATFAVNTLAHFWTVKAVLPSMKQCRDGLIVSVSSVVWLKMRCLLDQRLWRGESTHCFRLFLSVQMGLTSSAGLSDYSASKAAVNAFHESCTLMKQQWLVEAYAEVWCAFSLPSVVRLELQRDRVTHIRTLLVCPSAVNTGMFDGAFQGDSLTMQLARTLVPLLDEQDVVDCIYSAMVNGSKLLIYCSSGWRGWVFPWVPAIARLLPVAWYDFLVSLAGGRHAMDSFVGRKQNAPK